MKPEAISRFLSEKMSLLPCCNRGYPNLCNRQPKTDGCSRLLLTASCKLLDAYYLLCTGQTEMCYGTVSRVGTAETADASAHGNSDATGARPPKKRHSCCHRLRNRSSGGRSSCRSSCILVKA